MQEFKDIKKQGTAQLKTLNSESEKLVSQQEIFTQQLKQIQEKKKNEQRETGEVRARINQLKNTVEFQVKDEEIKI